MIVFGAEPVGVEDALGGGEERFRSLAESAPILIQVTDPEGHCLYVNKRWCETAGMKAEEALGRGWLDAIHEEDRALAAEQWRRSAGTEGKWGFEFRFKDRLSGKVTWMYGTVAPMLAANGTLIGYVGTNVDLTERRRSVQLLAWEKAALEQIGSPGTLREVLDSLVRGLEEQTGGLLCSVLLLDPDGKRLRHATGPSLPQEYSEAIDGITIGPTVGSCGTAAYLRKQVIVTDINTDPLWADFRELARQHGLRACWSTPIMGNGDDVLGTFAIYYREPRAPHEEELDLIARAVHITRIAIERKQAEEEILQLNASLEERVRARTAELEAANKELDAFSYSVSHDLRAPLRAIDGFSRLVMESHAESMDAEARRMLNIVRTETQRMGSLIDDLLAFSRLGRVRMEPVNIDMAVLAKSAFAELSLSEDGKTARLECRPMPPAVGTASMIRQVWINLLSNALKFTRTRENPTIEVGAMEGEAGTPVYYVKDNGVGFDMRFATHLFGVFQRLHSAKEFPGTGVGLALVQRIVQRHGGKVWVEAEVDRGATFYFTLGAGE